MKIRNSKPGTPVSFTYHCILKGQTRDHQETVVRASFVTPTPLVTEDAIAAAQNQLTIQAFGSLDGKEWLVLEYWKLLSTTDSAGEITYYYE